MPEVVRRKRRTLRIGVLALMLLTAFAGLTVLMSRLSVPPRSLAPYIEHRLSDHGPVFMRSGRWLAKLLTELDRGQNERRERPALRLGARAEVSPDLPPNQRAVSAATPEQILEAVADARPGDVITLEPGSYAFGSAGGFMNIMQPVIKTERAIAANVRFIVRVSVWFRGPVMADAEGYDR